MDLSITVKKSLFVAYPWDLYIQSMYEDIFLELFEEWDIRHGSNVTLTDPSQSQIEKFINRNKHLYDIFASAIVKSDFFIADVTGTNPNVMLELGIAIQLNKNVLIVTSDDLKKLPFDISGFRVSQYKTKNELKRIISEELTVYKKIKSQDFEVYYKEFYYSFPADGILRHANALPLPLPRGIKNARFRLDYKFIDESNSHDWLGVHLRAQLPDLIESELIYVRQNNKLESVSFPGKRAPKVGTSTKNDECKSTDGFKKLEIIIEENTISARTADSNLLDNGVLNNNSGGIFLHAFAHDIAQQKKLEIAYRNIEIISLDTTLPG